VAAARNDPVARFALIERTYHGPTGRAPRHLPFRRAALSFMHWQARRGLLNPFDASPPGSVWWRAVNDRLLRDGCEAVALFGGRSGPPSSRPVRMWLDFIDRPTGGNWYRAHNASIVAGYLENQTLAEAESAPERFFMNVALARVLYAHTLVAAPRLALGRLASLARVVGDPRLGMAGAFLSLRRVLPNRYPLEQDVESYIAKNNVSVECSTTRSSCRDCSGCTSGPPRSSTSRACSEWFATAARSTRGRTRSGTSGVLGTCHSRPGCSNASRRLTDAAAAGAESGQLFAEFEDRQRLCEATVHPCRP